MKKVGFFMRKREYKKTERRLLENWANEGAKLIKYIIFSGKYGRMEEKRVECFRK